MVPLVVVTPDLLSLSQGTIFEKLVQNIQKEADVAAAYAPKYDYDEHTPFNGARTFLKYTQEYLYAVHAFLIVDKEGLVFDSTEINNNTSDNRSWMDVYVYSPRFKHALDKHIHRTSQIPSDKRESLYHALYKIGLIVLRHCKLMHQLKSIMSDGDPYSSTMTEEKLRFMREAIDYWRDEDIKYLFTPEFTLWWLPGDRRKLISGIRQMILFAGSSPKKSFSALINSDMKRDLSHKFFLQTSSRQYHKIVSIVNSRAVTFVSSGGRYFSTSKIETVQVPRQSKYGFDSVKRGLCKTGAPVLENQTPTVEGLFFYGGSKESLANETNLLLHIHGSAFCITQPIHHSIYLDRWCTELKVPILAPNYSKAPVRPFPHAPQDNLDVYLFLTDEKNHPAIKKMLGFIPKNIVLSGDSAGGNLALSLMVAINEINRDRSPQAEDTDATELIPLPRAIALQYPTTSPLLRSSFSRFLTVFDSIIGPGVAFSFSSGYLLPEYVSNESKPWYFKPIEEAKQIYQKFFSLAKNPFISPMTYEHLDGFKDVPCFVQPAEFDILLDDSIEVAQKWRGPVILDVVPEASHGFMAGPKLPKVQQHINEFVEFIRENLVKN